MGVGRENSREAKDKKRKADQEAARQKLEVKKQKAAIPAGGRVDKKGCRTLDQIRVGLEDIKTGDSVLMRPPTQGTPPYIGRVEKIQDQPGLGIQVKVMWFYRPEEAAGGRKNFHGEKELFESNHLDWVSSQSIHGKCYVHPLKAYRQLLQVEELDYFKRFKYSAHKGVFKPDRVPVFCLCEMPYNPDQYMIECDSCKDWFHPACLNLAENVLEVQGQFVCPDCSKDGAVAGGVNVEDGSKRK